jgi:hypothetical protein
MARRCKDHSAIPSGLTGKVECPTCYIGYFTPHAIALSPAVPVLNYLCDYLNNTPTPEQKPLHKVCYVLRYSSLNLIKLVWLGV